jgi:7,8-dihydro-6-hydroxymethylpterin-pyrophosphokinase
MHCRRIDCLKKSNISPFYKTSAFPAGSGPDFVNGVMKAKTDLSAAELLARFT